MAIGSLELGRWRDQFDISGRRQGPLMDQPDDGLGSLLGLRKDIFEFHCHRDLT